MKIATLTLLFIAFGFTDNSTETAENLIPQYANQPMYLDLDINELVSLERQTLNMRAGGTSFRPKMIFFYEGNTSTFKVSAKEDLKFRIKMASPDIDPRELVQFGQFEVKRKRRNMVVQTLYTNGKRTVLNSDGLNFDQIDDSVYEITIDKDLEIGGEYALLCSNNLFAFGVVE